jgi:hypothetical protein
MTISRFDLITAGANFTVENFVVDRSAKGWFAGELALLSAGASVDFEPKADWREFMIRSTCDDGRVVHGPVELCRKGDPELARERLAELVAISDPEAGAALRQPWMRSSESPWPTAKHAAEDGLSLDALLFSAAEKADYKACQRYLDAGADALRETFDGDCAARVGIGNGLLATFAAAEYLNAEHRDTGATGLHTLALMEHVGQLGAAIRLGGDPNRPRSDGLTPLDLLNPLYHQEMQKALCEYEARTIALATPKIQASSEWSPSRCSVTDEQGDECEASRVVIRRL